LKKSASFSAEDSAKPLKTQASMTTPKNAAEAFLVLLLESINNDEAQSWRYDV
jgi:hypothetical protein